MTNNLSETVQNDLLPINTSESPSGSMTFDQLFSTGQIRLAEISVYNWGSFHGLHTGRIDPDGTLITGDNGSGKSTFVDGLMALLLPAGKATFNVAAAQGDRSDRSLMSYIRGSYGTEHDGSRTNTLNKRPGAVVSGLRAKYLAEDGSEITLAALFWMTQSSNALKDLNRLYMVGKRDLSLEELLKNFGKGNVRTLKQILRDDNRITLFDDRFTDYQSVYRRLLKMDNRNAPALLSRALGLKKIDDLTDLIRKLVLEPSAVQEHARKAVSSFDDLVSIYTELQDARSQQQQLAPLPSINEKLSTANSKVKDLFEQQSALPVWFGEQRHRLWFARIQTIDKDIQKASDNLKQLEQSEASCEELKESRYKDFIQAGGDRIEALEKLLASESQRLSDINSRARSYQQTVESLGLNSELAESVFKQNAEMTAESIHHLATENDARLDAYGSEKGQLDNLIEKGRQLEKEIEDIRSRPDSNIDHKYQKLRDEISASLNIPEKDVMFIGELIDVLPEHKSWQGAIERALGGLSKTLAVPESCFPTVTSWLNQRHTGLHVRVQVVRSSGHTADFLSDGYLKKLNWRKHPYRDWLKQHLSRFDRHCVAGTTALDATPFSMTEQGLIHFEKGRFEKKDQQKVTDRRFWQLGFSNKDRLALLIQDLKVLQDDIQQSTGALQEAKNALDQAQKKAQLWKKLEEFQWDEIDVPFWQNKVTSSKRELDNLQKSGGNLDQATLRLEEAKRELATVKNQKERVSNTLAVLNDNRQKADTARDKAATTAAEGMTDAARIDLNERIGELIDDDLDNSIGLQDEHQSGINQEKDRAIELAGKLKASVERIMVRFSENWSHIAADWPSTIEGLPDYILFLEKLNSEGLPELVERFKERLNRHTTQSLANISQKMAAEKEEIEYKICIINEVLARTEFKQNTHLRLGTKSEDFEHVKAFKKQLRLVLQQVNSDDHESRYQNLKKIIETLDKATATTTANNLESLRLLDSRYQLTFFAEEIDNASDKVLDVLDSSSGKSGGEKESFAGTIVAASLAYVLTPDGYDRPIYSTVFLDEAFSNTAESVSRRVLKVFRELHIHINLITPYKNLNLARESANSLIIAERDAQTHESNLCEVTWEEVDRRMDTFQASQEVIKELEIDVEPRAEV